MATLTALIAAACYAAAAYRLVARTRTQQTAPEPGLLSALALVGLAAHAVSVYQVAWGGSGLMLGLPGAASLMLWVSVAALLMAGLVRPLDNLGILVLPLAALGALAGGLWPSVGLQSDPRSIGFQTHVLTSVFAYGVLLLAACQSLLLAHQERRLLAHRPERVMRYMPPLAVQETVLFQLLGAGFFFLSLSLASGLVFVDSLFAQHLVHKTALSLLAWIIFGVLLWGRWRLGWRGRTALRLVIGGFITLALAYFGSKLVLELILGRHWFA